MFDVDNYPTLKARALTALVFYVFLAVLVVLVIVGWELANAWIAGEVAAALREVVQ